MERKQCNRQSNSIRRGVVVVAVFCDVQVYANDAKLEFVLDGGDESCPCNGLDADDLKCVEYMGNSKHANNFTHPGNTRYHDGGNGINGEVRAL